MRFKLSAIYMYKKSQDLGDVGDKNTTRAPNGSSNWRQIVEIGDNLSPGDILSPMWTRSPGS